MKTATVTLLRDESVRIRCICVICTYELQKTPSLPGTTTATACCATNLVLPCERWNRLALALIQCVGYNSSVAKLNLLMGLLLP